MAASKYMECAARILAICEGATAGDGAPHVSIGGSTVQRDRECVVREVPESVSISTVSTSVMGRSGARGCYRYEFSVPVEMWCKTRDLEAAASIVTGWCERVMAGVAADRTLGGACVLAEPYYGQGGTASDGDRGLYVAAIDMGVRVKADVDPANDFTDSPGTGEESKE